MQLYKVAKELNTTIAELVARLETRGIKKRKHSFESLTEEEYKIAQELFKPQPQPQPAAPRPSPRRLLSLQEQRLSCQSLRQLLREAHSQRPLLPCSRLHKSFLSPLLPPPHQSPKHPNKCWRSLHRHRLSGTWSAGPQSSRSWATWTTARLRS
jgi:hypothetical protein